MEANNTQSMREAVSLLIDALRDMIMGVGRRDKNKAAIAAGLAALDAPPRNCDVGTAEEQSKRFHSYCLEHNSACDVDMECCRCPLEKVETRCEFAWAQLPYEAQEGEGDGSK